MNRTFNFANMKTKVGHISLSTVKNAAREKGGILQIRPSW